MPLGEWLPRTAIQVVLASRRLPAGIKLVWELDFYLDQGPEGAWISGSNLAVRLGMTKETVEKYRRVLLRLGLHESRPRPGGGRTMSWYATLPTQCVPPKGMSIKDATALGSVLDQHIDATKNTGPASGIKSSHPPTYAGSESGIQQLADSMGKPDSSPVSRIRIPDSCPPQTRTPVHPYTGLLSTPDPDSCTPPIRGRVEGGGEREGKGRVSPSKSVYKTPSVSPGKRAREGSQEPVERERVAEDMVGIMARWNQKRSRQ